MYRCHMCKENMDDATDSACSFSGDGLELEDKSEGEIKNDLSAMSFEELQSLKEKIGLKMYKEAVFGLDRKKPNRNFTRDNKNRPREMTAKQQVPVYREVFQAKRKVKQDPRFDARAGDYNERAFRESYSFVNDIRSRERQELVKMVQEEKDLQQRMKLKGLLQKMENQEATEKMKSLKDRLDDQYSQFLADNRESKPLFLNKTARRKIELAERFKLLKKAGKLDKYLEKRRKKNVQKERKKLPLSVT